MQRIRSSHFFPNHFSQKEEPSRIKYLVRLMIIVPLWVLAFPVSMLLILGMTYYNLVKGIAKSCSDWINQ